MLDILTDIMNVNFVTAIAVVCLAAGSGFILREMTDSNLMTSIAVPFMAFGALVSIYSLGQAGIFFTREKEANDLISSGFGMILALLLMLAAIRIWVRLGDLRRPPDPDGRLLETDPGT